MCFQEVEEEPGTTGYKKGEMRVLRVGEGRGNREKLRYQIVCTRKFCIHGVRDAGQGMGHRSQRRGGEGW